MLEGQTRTCGCQNKAPTKENKSRIDKHTGYCIQVGIYYNYNKAMELQLKLLQEGMSSEIIIMNEKYAVVTGYFRELDRAADLECYLRFCGYNTLLISS